MWWCGCPERGVFRGGLSGFECASRSFIPLNVVIFIHIERNKRIKTGKQIFTTLITTLGVCFAIKDDKLGSAGTTAPKPWGPI